MKVYCLFKGYDYEGDSLLGIFDSIEKANNAALELANQGNEGKLIESTLFPNSTVCYRTQYGCEIYTQIEEVL